MSKLFSPLQIGAFNLAHRVVMPPLTRMRAAQPGDVPTPLMTEYYAQRSSAGGLIIAEASQISLQGKGYPATPGIHTDEQIRGWRAVTDAVHARGGIILLQLWHVGRVAHSSLSGGAPVSASAVPSTGKVFSSNFRMVDAEIPRALEPDGLDAVINDYRQAARNARAAGFDGVEVHGANGYLPDQFLQDRTNKRSDHYGGSIENRCRFLNEVVGAVIEVWGADRVGVRLAPYGRVNDMADSNPRALFTHALGMLRDQGVAYAHLIEPRSNAGVREEANAEAPNAASIFRSAFPGVLIASGGFTRETALEAVERGEADAIAFGRAFIANPDLPFRLRADMPLTPYDRATFYGGGETGYTDYAALSAE